MAGFSRVISMQDWMIGLGVVPKRKPNLSGLSLPPIVPFKRVSLHTCKENKGYGKRLG